ncbi:MAG: GAF domain-containing protein [Planctomycetes bacterium]|nr:GAF domain-containing protein [Planctomycetota bacterium]
MPDRAALNQKKLDLVMAMDFIRDTASEPQVMLAALVNLLAEHLHADGALLYLLDEETGKAELKAASENVKALPHLESRLTRDLVQLAWKHESVTAWDREGVEKALGIDVNPASLRFASIPIALGRKTLGALLLARSREGFSREDLEILQVVETQLDSAVVQAHTFHELQQRNKELETLYRIDCIRDRNLPLDEMLTGVLHEMSRTIEAEMGFVMLYDRGGKQLKLQCTTRGDLARLSPYQETLNRIAGEAVQRGTLIRYNALGDVLQSVLCTPLLLHNEIIGVLGLANRYRPGGFHVDDGRLLGAIASQIDTAIFESLERRRLRKVLGRCLEPRVLDRVLATPDVEMLKGERAVLTVLYSDVRGSTRLAEISDPELLVGFMNDYLGRMTSVILSHEGTLDKFVGDEVMALFGAPIPHPDHALCAVRVGMAMQVAHREVMMDWEQRGLDPAPIGIGIATGEMIVGEMGCAQRTDYTVIGRAANLGARICSAAGPGQVLISQGTFDLVRQRVEAQPVHGLQLKGLGQEITAYLVQRVNA